MTDGRQLANAPLKSHPGTRRSVELAQLDDRVEWDNFVASHSSGSFYHLYDWKAVTEESLGHKCFYLASRNDCGDIDGVLPLVFIQSRLFGRIFCSLPFVNYGGPLSSNEDSSNLLIEHAISIANEYSATFLELRCAKPLTIDLPVSLRKVSLCVPLTADPEELFSSFSQKHRKNIRRAQKNDLEVKTGGAELLDDFYMVIEQSWRALGTPLYSRSYFSRIAETFSGNTNVFVCMHKGTPIGAALVGHLRGVVEGMWAGGVPALRNLDANYVLYWEMLRHACLTRQSVFHLGRSTARSGAEQFKSKWNAESQQLYWYYHRPGQEGIPSLNVDNPKFKLAIATWKRLPFWLTRAIGPRIARLIP